MHEHKQQQGYFGSHEVCPTTMSHSRRPRLLYSCSNVNAVTETDDQFIKCLTNITNLYELNIKYVDMQ